MYSLHSATSHDLEQRTIDCEYSRVRIMELTNINEPTAKNVSLQKAMARAGRDNERPLDSEVSQRFVTFNSDIMNFLGQFYAQ